VDRDERAAIDLADFAGFRGEHRRRLADAVTNPLARRFPVGFVWGVATSAYQIEGAAHEDGRGESIWDEFTRRPGAIRDGSSGDRACDHYHRLDADLDLMASLGIRAYRFSMSWPRVQPIGEGPWNEAGFGFYERVIDGLIRRGIAPHLTLYHWDLPQALQVKGGWADRGIIDRFVRYAAEVGRRFGNRVASIATHNEPWVVAVLGHETGVCAPGQKSRKTAMQVAHHLLVSHGLALQVLRSGSCTAPLGIVLNQSPIHAATDSAADLAKARLDDGLLIRWYLDPLLRGAYPDDVMAHLAADAPRIEDGDMALIRQPLDFLGINYYTRAIAGRRQPDHMRREFTAMGWEVFPDGLRELLMRLHADYRLPPVYIMENGAAYPDQVSAGRVADVERIRYLSSHIAALADAIEGGVDVRGYFVWSLLDNFEWADGYSKRFGIVYVDYSTQQRICKDSAIWYQEFLSPGDTSMGLQLLSNGRYHVMVTGNGGGYSRWKNIAITRWREDATCDNWGTFCYIRDHASGAVWSTAHQPTRRRADHCDVVFEAGRAAVHRRDFDVDVETVIAVSPHDDVEVRRIRITNRAQSTRQLDVTSYAEIVLGDAGADTAHPAFQKLFVETEIVRDCEAILAKRRARSAAEHTPWMFHALVAEGRVPRSVSFESDRMQFIGRGRSSADPQALDRGGTLSNSAGSVLDPVAAIRCEVSLEPGQTSVVNLIMGVGDSRAECIALAQKYRNRQALDDVLTAAPLYARAMQTRLGATEADARLFTTLAFSILHAGPWLRAETRTLEKNAQGQSGLWRHGISGDLPIVLLQTGGADLAWARKLLDAHTYWALQGLLVDLVILAADPAGILSLIRSRAGDSGGIDKPGGIFVRSADAVPEADRILLQAAARVALDDRHGSLTAHIHDRLAGSVRTQGGKAARSGGDGAPAPSEQRDEPLPADLILQNGLGGFTADGRAYLMKIKKGHMTPSPWVNILANPVFGSLITESGSASTWSENAQEFRLTPWSNDPVGDANTEAFYLRDESSGEYWSPTLLPCPGATHYLTRHGFGSSVFTHNEGGVHSELIVYVAVDSPVKFAVLQVRNDSGRPRRLSVTGYVEWVLGGVRTKTATHVRTNFDMGSGAVFACNPYNTDFAGRTAFFAIDDAAAASWCADRREFLGSCGTLQSPAAMSEARLSGSVGTALDPCAAIRVPFELSEGQSQQIVFRLGAAASAEEAVRLLQDTRGTAAARAALAAVNSHWTRTLGAVQIETPDRALDVLANGWLVYQILSSRFWARNGFYQSSGAFGFRDQLQDVMALVHTTPALVRDHLLRCASRQFVEGDVQHWWHPPAGRGVRTLCSDDYLWLALATCRYVGVTGDTGVLDEPVHFLEGRPLKDGEESYYDLPRESSRSASLYEHCARAVNHGLRVGVHGLPLMGSGDWNDGMNLVGIEGRGESVWLGFFLYAVLTQFGELAKRRGDTLLASGCTSEALRLRGAIERSSWDGDWYRRGWFDDGSPLGTSRNAECRIDSIAQSWSVLSGAGDPVRSRRAMRAVDAQLVRRDAGLVQLLDPPFDRSDPNPGYIQGYVRGVRENGGQYTHAAVWTTMAFAALGDVERAWELMAMINPINHANSPQGIATYRSEPYVVAADVYALAPHVGRGGWTWYTGSAGWMYRLIVESLLGLTVQSGLLSVHPCIPKDWKSYRLEYRFHETSYAVTVSHIAAGETPGSTVDGVAVPGTAIRLINDQGMHVVAIKIPPPPEFSPDTAPGP
jgi:beta-galactosidase